MKLKRHNLYLRKVNIKPINLKTYLKTTNFNICYTNSKFAKNN